MLRAPPAAPQTKQKLYDKDLDFSYKPFLSILGTGLVTANGAHWQKQRLLMAPALRIGGRACSLADVRCGRLLQTFALPLACQSRSCRQPVNNWRLTDDRVGPLHPAHRLTPCLCFAIDAADMLDAIIPIAKTAVDRLCKQLEGYRGTGRPGGWHGWAAVRAGHKCGRIRGAGNVGQD